MKNVVWMLSVFLLSCMNVTDKRKAFLKEKGIQEIKVGDVQLTSRIMPDGIKEENGIIYFNVRIEKGNDKNLEKAKVLYLNFDMQKDFLLQIDQQQLAPSFCQKIENGRANIYEYIIAFDAPQEEMRVNRMTLMYQDKIFGAGIVAFVYDQSDLKNSNLKVKS